MCLKAITYIRERDIRPSGCKFVALALADHANANWTCFPSVRRLAFYTSLSNRSVRTHLNSLASMGIITRKRRQREDGTLAGYSFFIQRQKPPELGGTSGKKQHKTTSKLAAHETSEETSIHNNNAGQSEKRSAIPSDWEPDSQTRLLAIQQYHYDEEELDDVIEDFKDYWDNKRNCSDGKKRSWSRTFRMQLRRLGKKKPARHKPNKPSTTTNSHGQEPSGIAGAAMRRAYTRKEQDDVPE